MRGEFKFKKLGGFKMGKKIILLILLTFLFNGCIGVKGDKSEELEADKTIVEDMYAERITRTEYPESLNWFKSKSESQIKNIDSGILWSPVKKPTTIHSYFRPAKFEIGKTIKFKMMWESDGMDDSNKEINDPHKSNISGQGKGISDRYLRMLAGTGDFRIGFFESDKKVGNNTFEGKVSGATKDFNNYKGFQVRVHPHLGEGYKDINRLSEIHDNGKKESHANFQMWTRFKAGTYGLMSDEAQNSEDDYAGGRSFSKDDKWGVDAIGFGPNAPFGKPTPFILEIKKVSETNFEVLLTINNNSTPLLKGNFNKGFVPEYFDTIAITYTNSSRRYSYVKITDFKVETDDNSITPTPTPTPTPLSTVMEGEQAELKGFYISDNKNASNGKYIYSKKDSKDKADENNKAVFKFNLNESGKYKVVLRTASIGRTKDANSFYVKVNNEKIKTLYTKRSQEWQEETLEDTYVLEKGENIVTVYARESYASLDKVELKKIN